MSSTPNVCLENGSGLGRERLGRPALFARHRGLRDRTLLDGPDRLTRVAIEYIEPAGLAGHRDDVTTPALVADRRELRRRVRVHVPQIVMHHLEVPAALAGAHIQRDDRSAEQVRPDTVRAVEIVGGRSQRDVGDAARGIDRHLAPVVDAADVSARRPWARCRSRTRPAAARCGRSTPACPSARRRRGYRPAATCSPHPARCRG